MLVITDLFRGSHGAGIRKAKLGDIDMRSIAPTLAKVLGVQFGASDAPVLGVF